MTHPPTLNSDQVFVVVERTGGSDDPDLIDVCYFEDRSEAFAWVEALTIAYPGREFGVVPDEQWSVDALRIPRGRTLPIEKDRTNARL